MARFHVYRRSGEPLLLDCQTDLIAYVETRLVVPLVPIGKVPQRMMVMKRLVPIFEVLDEQVVMMTPLMAAIPVANLGRSIADLSERHAEIMSAIDMLISGF